MPVKQCRSWECAAWPGYLMEFDLQLAVGCQAQHGTAIETRLGKYPTKPRIALTTFFLVLRA